MIQLKKGMVFPNKTLMYLSSILNTLDSDFITKWGLVRSSVQAFAIQDYAYNDAYGLEKTSAVLFVVIDAFGPYNKAKEQYFNIDRGINNLREFLQYYRRHPTYFADYIFDEIASPSKRCIAINLGDKWQVAFEKFEKGAFSEMFTLDEIKDCRIDPSRSDLQKEIFYVLTKNPLYKEAFLKKLKRVYKLTDREVRQHRTFDTEFPEMEIKPALKLETLNYSKVGKNKCEEKGAPIRVEDSC